MKRLLKGLVLGTALLALASVGCDSTSSSWEVFWISRPDVTEALVCGRDQGRPVHLAHARGQVNDSRVEVQ
jgi:hypothetical protein